MSSCLSGGGRTYGIDLEIVKSSPTSTRTSNSSSPSSTLSESINSPLTIRKPRTPRKRPNQTYNEAAALLSTVYPNIFSTKNLRKPSKHTKVYNSLSEEFAEFLPRCSTFENAEFLLHRPISEKPIFRIEPKPMNSSEKPCQGLNIDCDFRLDSLSPCDAFKEDFDADSILDEEMEEGIDSIMGNLRMNNDTYDDSNVSNGQIDAYYENSMGFDFCGKFEFGFGSIRPLRCIDDGDWWRFPAINVLDISPKLNKVSFDKKEKLERGEELKNFPKSSKEKTNSSLSLKLNYDEILNAWSNRGSPFSDDIPGTEYSEADAIARLAQIDLFSENGGMREASVLRYREKKRSRLFSKKIRYQVRKINADQRPRMKGRFVRRPTSTLKDQEMKIK